MKKVFILSRGLEKFSTKQLENMEIIVGGRYYEDDTYTYIPTGGGGRTCLGGYVYSETLGKCVPLPFDVDEVLDVV